MANEAVLQANNFLSTPAATNLRVMDGNALVVGSRIDALMARGYCWHTTVGSFSTGILGGGSGTAIDEDQPELSIDVPDGYTTIPVRISIQAPPSVVSSADSEEHECLIMVDRTQVSSSLAADGTVEVPANMRTDKVGGCPNDVVSYVLNTAVATNAESFDLAHTVRLIDYNATTEATAIWCENSLLYEPKNPPLIVGPANISCYFGSTLGSTGFIQAVWATIATSKIDDLL